MVFDDHLKERIFDQLLSLPFWKDYWSRASVAVVGSVGAGFGDEHSDLDIHVLVSKADHDPLYGLYKKGMEAGDINILNPRAFLFDEFPLTYLAGIDGYYQVVAYEPIEKRIRVFDDVERWVYANCKPIHDPTGRLASIVDEAEQYPAAVLNEKLCHHYYQSLSNFWPTKGPLARGQKETVSLLCVQGISHLLKFCVLADGGPFPYDKWLYRTATATPLGKLLHPYIDAMFAEIHSNDIVYEKPENYRIYHLFDAMRKVLDANRPKLDNGRGLVY